MYQREGDGRGGHDHGCALLAEVLCVKTFRHEEAEEQKVQHDGEYHEGGDGYEGSDDPITAPIAVRIGLQTVFLFYGLGQIAPIAAESAQQRDVVRTAVHEDVLLDLRIALLGIVVQIAQSSLRAIVVADILLQLTLSVGQHLLNARSQCQTRVSTHDPIGS